MRPKLIIFGSAASLGLLGFYVGVMSIDGGIGLALRELVREWWLIGGIVVAFGIQVALISHIHARVKTLRSNGASSATGTMTAATSAGSMLACCLHHVSDVLPFIGATALGTFFGQYRSWLFALAYLSSAIGISLMVRSLRHLPHAQRHGAAAAEPCH